MGLSASPLRILIADDVDSNRLILRRFVERIHHNTVEASNGREALELLQSGDIDIALLDIMMPQLSGIEVCREIRKTKSATVLPILFITARSEDADIVDGLSAGGNDYITKPVNATILLARLQTQIRQLQTSRALERTYDSLAKRKRMESVALFAAGVAHNFNNILGTILGSAELIQLMAKEQPKVTRSAELILKAGRRGADLTESLRAFCRPEGDGRTSNVYEMAHAAIELLPIPDERFIAISLDIDRHLQEARISGPELCQVFIELLTNAIRAIPEDGAIAIRGHCDAEQETIVVRISDSGRGIPEAKRDIVFEPFVSASNFDTLVGITLDGTGLGLSVTYHVIASNHGEIVVENTGATGTTIRVTLPAEMRSQSERELPADYASQ